MLGMSKRSAVAGTQSATTAVQLGPERGVGVARREVVPAARRPLAVGVEQLVVVRPADLLGDERVQVAVELDRLGLRQQAVDGRAVEEAGERCPRRLQPVVELGPVRHAAARPDVEHGLVAARFVAQRAVGRSGFDEATAPPLRHEHEQVGERLAEPEGDDVGARPQDRQVLLGRVAGGDVGESPFQRPAVQRAAVGRVGVEVAERRARRGRRRGRRPRRRARCVGGRRARRRRRPRSATWSTISISGGVLASTRSRNHSRYADCTSRVGNVVPVRPRISAATSGGARRASVSSSTVHAHSASDGPGSIGPAHRTDSSVNIVTSSAIEFIHNRGCWSGRQTRPSPRRCGSIRWMRSAAPSSSSALATRRSTSEAAVGPAPTTASSRVGIEQAYVKVDQNGRDCVVAGTWRPVPRWSRPGTEEPACRTSRRHATCTSPSPSTVPATTRPRGAIHRPGRTELFTARYWVDQVQRAEHGRLDFVSFEDEFGMQSGRRREVDTHTDQVRGRLDAVLLASRVAPATKHIGLLPIATVTYPEPFHIASAVSTLDWVSKGRGGWQPRVSGRPSDAALVGVRAAPDPETGLRDLFDEAADAVEVVRRLWDSWEDDAIIKDVATGRFVDRDKLHYIDFEGRFFSVKGPSIVPRPPSGQPIVAVLAHQPIPFEFAARSGDVVFVTPAEHGRRAALDRRHPRRRGNRRAGRGTAAPVRRRRRVPGRGPRRGRRPQGRARRPGRVRAPLRRPLVHRHGRRARRPHRGVARVSASRASASARPSTASTCRRSSTTSCPSCSAGRCSGATTARRRCASGSASPDPPAATRGARDDDGSAAQADHPRRPLPGRQQHERVERSRRPEPGRVRLVRPPRPDGRAGEVRLLLPRRGSPAARAAGQDPRPRRRRAPRHAGDPVGRRCGHRRTSGSPAR